MKKTGIPLNLKFFSNDDATPPADTSPVENQMPQSQPPVQPIQPTNYEDLLKTDKAFQSFVDATITKATQTAVQNAITKQQRLADEKLSESERLKEMTADQKAAYWEQKAKDAEKARLRDKEVDGLKAQTVIMLKESAIPDVFLDVFDFANATAEDIQGRIKMLTEYEYPPRGTLQKAIDDGIMAGLDAKLKQASPESRGIGSGDNGFQSKYDAARIAKNTALCIQIKREAHAAGIIIA
jgi:hypothetical protein